MHGGGAVVAATGAERGGGGGGGADVPVSAACDKCWCALLCMGYSLGSLDDERWLSTVSHSTLPALSISSFI